VLTIPNAVTLLRIPFGALVGYFGSQQQWPSAFLCFAAGLFTDWFDGFLAIKLNQKSELGGKILEPGCDFALTLGAVCGLFFSANIGWTTILALSGILLAIWLPVIFSIGPEKLIRIFKGIAPFYYLAVVLSLFVIYAMLAGILTWLLIIAIPIAPFAAYAKRGRIRQWLGLILN
jgi:cardiolipin synthase (CMP-forming)